jgi:hypothetical protein
MQTHALGLRRRLAFVTLIVVTLVMISARGDAQSRDSSSQTQKVYLRINTEKLSLVWNGDQGEGGRGRGEIFVSTWVTWPTDSEMGDPQTKVVGPLNGDAEFPSGTIVEGPPGTFTVEPGMAPDGQFGQIYYNKADCPVNRRILVDVLVWDEDSNKTLDEFFNLITQAGKVAAGAGVQGAELAAAVLNAIIKALTASGDDALGRVQNFPITIPDPCAGDFGPITVSVPLVNLAKDLWRSANAEDETGRPFRDVGIEPPEVIGTLDLQIIGGPITNKFSDIAKKPRDPLAFQELISVDIGQPNEGIVTGVLELGSNLPLSPPPITYSLFLDVDNDPTTGAATAVAPGAEFQAEVTVEVTDAVTARLLAFNPVTMTFETIPDGIYDVSLDIDRSHVFVSLALDTLGNPAGPIAAWAAVETGGVVTDVFPPSPVADAPAITIDRSFTGINPFIVTTAPTHDSIDVTSVTDICVTFSKIMDRADAQAAFSVSPPVPGTFLWQGDRVCLRPSAPLAPFTLFEATVGPTATDTTGAILDGDGDTIPGDAFVWRFTTAPLPLGSRAATGDVQGGFEVSDPVYAAGSSFTPSMPVTVYVVAHTRAQSALGGPLVDRTADGPTLAVTGADGSLPLTLLPCLAHSATKANSTSSWMSTGTACLRARSIGLMPRALACLCCRVPSAVISTGMAASTVSTSPPLLRLWAQQHHRAMRATRMATGTSPSSMRVRARSNARGHVVSPDRGSDCHRTGRRSHAIARGRYRNCRHARGAAANRRLRGDDCVRAGIAVCHRIRPGAGGHLRSDDHRRRLRHRRWIRSNHSLADGCSIRTVPWRSRCGGGSEHIHIRARGAQYHECVVSERRRVGSPSAWFLYARHAVLQHICRRNEPSHFRSG